MHASVKQALFAGLVSIAVGIPAPSAAENTTAVDAQPESGAIIIQGKEPTRQGLGEKDPSVETKIDKASDAAERECSECAEQGAAARTSPEGEPNLKDPNHMDQGRVQPDGRTHPDK
jgi:hypothetical protein